MPVAQSHRANNPLLLVFYFCRTIPETSALIAIKMRDSVLVLGTEALFTIKA